MALTPYIDSGIGNKNYVISPNRPLIYVQPGQSEANTTRNNLYIGSGPVAIYGNQVPAEDFYEAVDNVLINSSSSAYSIVAASRTICISYMPSGTSPNVSDAIQLGEVYSENPSSVTFAGSKYCWAMLTAAGETSNATPLMLQPTNGNGNAMGGGILVPNFRELADVDLSVIGMVAGTGETVAFRRRLITRDGLLLATQTIGTDYKNAALSAANIAVVYPGTEYQINVTGVAGKTIQWHATITGAFYEPAI
jgi:hypothetical protein